MKHELADQFYEPLCKNEARADQNEQNQTAFMLRANSKMLQKKHLSHKNQIYDGKIENCRMVEKAFYRLQPQKGEKRSRAAATGTINPCHAFKHASVKLKQPVQTAKRSDQYGRYAEKKQDFAAGIK